MSIVHTTTHTPYGTVTPAMKTMLTDYQVSPESYGIILAAIQQLNVTLNFSALQRIAQELIGYYAIHGTYKAKDSLNGGSVLIASPTARYHYAKK